MSKTTYRFWGSKMPSAKARPLAVFAPRVAGDTTVATVRIYGPIDSWGGWWGVSAKEVAAALDALDGAVTEIQLRLNSPGGEATEGVAIANLLRAHPAKVVGVVDGLAASAASLVAVACDELVMSPGSQLMIHDAWSGGWGNAAELRKEADVLDSISDSYASVYAEKAGGTTAAWREAMVAETWFTADETVAAGLAARVAVVPDAGQATTAGTPPEDDEIGSDGEFYDLASMFTYAGRKHAPAPAAAISGPKPPTASAGGSTTTQEGSAAVSFTDAQLATMRTKLGIAGDADEATILAALDEALNERAEPTSSNVPQGHVVIPAAKLADLEAGAEAGAQAAKTLRERERKEFLDSVATKYAPGNREAWEAEYDRNPAGTRAHFEKAPDLVPVGEVGHALAADETAPKTSVKDDETYKNWRF